MDWNNPYMRVANGYGYGNNGFQNNNPNSMAAQPQQSQSNMIWVDGEVGAKAFQMPQNWPANIPIALWDTNDTVIYLKSTNPMGMPNPLQRLRYSMEEQQNQSYLPASGSSVNVTPEQNYVTKEDFESQMKELKDLLKAIPMPRNQNNGQQNRGGNA